MNLVVEKDTNHWINEFHKGNDLALAHFFDLHYKPLCYFARRLTQNAIEAEDIASECFIKLWNQDHKTYTEENIKAFLYICCKNACLNYLKRLKVKSKAQKLYHSQLNDSDETVLNKIIEAEVLNVLVSEIELLPEKCREVFKLIYFDQKKTDEIATELGLSPKTVRNHKARAIELLRSSILKKGYSTAVLFVFLLFLDNR